MEPTLLSLLSYATVTLGVTAVYQIIVGLWSRDELRVQERMGSEFARDATTKPALFKNLDQLDLDRTTDSSPDWGLPEEPAVAPKPTGPRARLADLMEQSGVPLSLGQLVLISVGLALALGAPGAWFRGPLLGALGAVVGAVTPLLYVRWRRNARREQLLSVLPKAFDLMARVLRAGNSVPQALQAVADTLDGPIADEFARCQKQQSLGLRPDLTFQEMAERIGILDMRIFVMAMLIQRQTGGNLSEVLERLATLMRDRLRIRRQVRALTAEGRLQGLTLSVLPFLMFAAMMIVNRTYAQVLLEHGTLLLATGASIAVGMLWIRKIVNFDI